MAMSTASTSRAWIELNGAALRRNAHRITAAINPGTRLLPMVKANAYGLGVEGAVAALSPTDPWGYGVATVPEGVELRGLGVDQPILVFTPIDPTEVAIALAHRLTLCISSLAELEELANQTVNGGHASFHVEIDTGMGRAGFDCLDAAAWAKDVRRIAASVGLDWQGCFTHFHSADHLDGAESILSQWKAFEDAVEMLSLESDSMLIHVANSAAVLRCPTVAADMVRPGIFLYGGSAGTGLADPEPVASLKARVTLVRDVPEGATVGYGALHVATTPQRWATLPIGYGDGLPVALGNRGSALLRGSRVPMVGRISMDMTVVDISGVPAVETGDVATLIGSDGPEEICLGEVAELADTIDYEILTRLGSRLPRVWRTDVDA